MTIGVYAGSFDPITKGHLAVVRQALKVVDTLHVVVAINPAKKGMFESDERMLLIKASIKEELAYIGQDRIVVDCITNALTVAYARLVDAKILVRGLRNGADYAYERSQATINRKLAPEIETIFIPTPVDYEEVSSSTVKGLMKFDGGEVAASEFVTPAVLAAIKARSFF